MRGRGLLTLCALVVFAGLPILGARAQDPSPLTRPGGGGGGITASQADLSYLRLDASNDPVTGVLDIDANVLLGDVANDAGLSIRNNQTSLIDIGTPAQVLFEVQTSPSPRVRHQSAITDLCFSGTCNIEWTSGVGTAAGRIFFDDADGVATAQGLWYSTVASGGDAHTFDTDNAMASNGNLFIVNDAGTEAFRINGDGHAVPGADGTYDLGSETGADRNWRVLHVQTIQNGAAGAGTVLSVADALFPAADSTYNMGNASTNWMKLFVEELENGGAGGGGVLTMADNVVPDADSANDLGGVGADWANLYVDQIQSDGSTIALNDDLVPTGAWDLGSSAADMAIVYTDRIQNGTSGGSDNVEVADDVEPFTDDSYNLGNASKRWDALFLAMEESNSPAQPFDCDATVAGALYAVDDTNDAKIPSLCLCGRDTDDTTYVWTPVGSGGAVCPN